jgi:hypothetical protein
VSDSLSRVLEAIHQTHRIETGKLAFQLAVYRKQLTDAGITPDDMGDEELMRLWRSAADTVSAASAFVAELGSGKELLDRKLIPS